MDIEERRKPTMAKRSKQSRTQFSFRILAFTLAALLLSPTFCYAAGNPVTPDTAATKDTQATVSFTAGSLTLNSAPVLDFGEHKLSGTQQVYNAASITDWVEISDQRSTGAGWKLTAKLSEFKLADGSKATLKGAFITIADQTIESATRTTGEPTGISNVTLTAGDNGSTNILSADSGKGQGVWKSIWSDPDTTLTVLPDTAELGSAYATINWNLEDAP